MGLERKVTRINNLAFKLKTNIVIYCRVSTPHENQLDSLTNQIEHFQKIINQHIDWELVDVYADVKSGKNTTGRSEFQRMLADCHNHKIDLILTKSISRFGRNTVETLDVINELRRLYVDVLFEVEKIQISETNKMFLISILEAVAQAESESRSQNIKWGIKRQLESGTSKLYSRRCYGYSYNSDGSIFINEKEALVIKKIFDLYLKGYSILAITRELENEGIKSPTGKESWPKRTIETILSNEKYIGNSVVGKTYTKDFPKNSRYTNKDEHPKYQATGTHPPFISEEQFEAVQQEKLRRSNIHRNHNGTVSRKSSHYSMKSSSDSSKSL